MIPWPLHCKIKKEPIDQQRNFTEYAFNNSINQVQPVHVYRTGVRGHFLDGLANLAQLLTAGASVGPEARPADHIPLIISTCHSYHDSGIDGVTRE